MDDDSYWWDSSVDKMFVVQMDHGSWHALRCFTAFPNPSVCGGEKGLLDLLARLGRLATSKYLHKKSGTWSRKLLTLDIGPHAHHTHMHPTHVSIHTQAFIHHTHSCKNNKEKINSEPEGGLDDLADKVRPQVSSIPGSHKVTVEN